MPQPTKHEECIRTQHVKLAMGEIEDLCAPQDDVQPKDDQNECGTFYQTIDHQLNEQRCRHFFSKNSTRVYGKIISCLNDMKRLEFLNAWFLGVHQI